MKKRTGLYPAVQADAAAVGVVSHAGGVALLETVRAAGLDRALSDGLGPWRKPTAVHDPGKVLIDLAVSLAMTGQRLSYSVGFGLPSNTAEVLTLIPDDVWQVALDSDGCVRDGAWVAELTGLLELTGWPPGMRVIARKERPHPGAQLRITDIDGLRVTAFATNTRPGGPSGQLADLELRHRRRARCEDRIRCAKDTGLANLPLHDMDQNRIWLAVVSLACELTAWLQMLTLAGHAARRWEPKRLRLRLFSIAGRLARSGRRSVLHLSNSNRWTSLLLEMITTLRGLPAPAG